MSRDTADAITDPSLGPSKMMMSSDQKFRWAGTIVFVLALLLAVYLTKDVFVPFLLGFLLAYVFYPAYKWLLKRTGSKSASSFITMLLILGIVLIPAFGFIGVLIQEITKIVDLGGLTYIQGMASTLLEGVKSFAEAYLPTQFADRLESIGDLWKDALVRISPVIQEGLMNFVSNVPLVVTEMLVAAFFTYYFLIDGRGLIDRAVGLMPRREVMGRFLMELDAIYSSFFRLLFVTAAIIAAIGAIGYLLLGVSYPVLLGVLTGVTSLVPMVGPAVIFGPIAVYFLILQDYVRAFATIIFGIVFLTVLPGNFILPKLAARGASIHPLVTLLAFTAPLLVVGVMGMIIGPAVYGFVLAGFRTWIYFKEMKSGDGASVAPDRL
ncbi:MAG: AI-2E family transporter [Methanothrix sp.]|nr:AI-2E family transporter [Methanothrix sp.]